jgi:RNA polymerase sigma-70 factor (ECF subfamily)
VCRRIVGNEADADDATQEALLAVVRGLDRFVGRSQFGTWVYRVAVNACLDELRRRRRRPAPAQPSEVPERVAGDAPALDTAVAARLDIDVALAALPTNYRAAVVLRDLAGLDYEEISRVLDVPIGTVRSRIARGRATLALSLSQQTTPAETPTRAEPDHGAGNSEPPTGRPRR